MFLEVLDSPLDDLFDILGNMFDFCRVQKPPLKESNCVEFFALFDVLAQNLELHFSRHKAYLAKEAVAFLVSDL